MGHDSKWIKKDNIPVYYNSVFFLFGNSQYGKRAGILNYKKKKTSHTRLYPATPHTYTVQSCFFFFQLISFYFIIIFLPIQKLTVFPCIIVYFPPIPSITNVCKWVLWYTLHKPDSGLLPFVLWPVTFMNIWNKFTKKKNTNKTKQKKTLNVQYVAKIHPTSYEFKI